jgi:hypothetical protein
MQRCVLRFAAIRDGPRRAREWSTKTERATRCPRQRERQALLKIPSLGFAGQLHIYTAGEVYIASDPSDPSAAGAFTSLDGASYTLPH